MAPAAEFSTWSFSVGLILGGGCALVLAVIAIWQWRRAITLSMQIEQMETLAETRQAANEEWRPLQDKLTAFESLVRETYEREGRERFHLEKEISWLAEETQSLSRSLRGDSKVQGDWGEVLVEKILESSGLRSGFEFDLQSSHVDSEGRTQRPDVIVKLPGDRELIIDAKVSLTAWDRFCRSETDDERDDALADHVQSLRRHIQSLGAKRYHQAKASPEFVFLFTRIEPAWIEALRADPALLDDAAKAGVAVVSPTTLFASLKTVASLWGRDRQNRNALQIAEEAGKLYDKFVQFAGDLGEVENDLAKATESLASAKRKLTDGPGNLASRAEKIRELGAKTTKKLSDVLREDLGADRGDTI